MASTKKSSATSIAISSAKKPDAKKSPAKKGGQRKPPAQRYVEMDIFTTPVCSLTLANLISVGLLNESSKHINDVSLAVHFRLTDEDIQRIVAALRES